MSLKHFHVFFIATVIALSLFLAHWARVMPGPARVPVALTAALCLSTAVPYLFWFSRRYKSLA